MLSILMLILVGVVLYMFLRRRRPAADNDLGRRYDGGPLGGLGGMGTGLLLGYLLSNMLIDHQQYAALQNLSPDALRDTLAAQGILSGDDFDALAQKALAGELQPQDLSANPGDGTAGWSDGGDGFAGGDGGGFDDFGGDGFGGDVF